MTHTSISLPQFVPEQIAAYQGDHLLTHEVCRFDPAIAVNRLQADRQVMAIDIGGDKIRSAIYAISNGSITRQDEQVVQSRGGAGYLAFLERLANKAAATGLPVGISTATKLDGTRVSRTVNLPQFRDEITTKYGADFRNLFPTCAFVANDTIAGICGASTLLALQGTKIDAIAFVICASGLGGSVITEHTATHVEVGHVPLVHAFNPLGQTTPCGVEGRDFVCVERVTAARAGIEDLYRHQTGESQDGVSLGRMYEQGDPLATTLYETSARVLAHAIAGLMERYAFDRSEQGVVVLHGGNFEVTQYRERLQENLKHIPGPTCHLVFSRDLSSNVCIDGAAIGASYYHGQTHQATPTRGTNRNTMPDLTNHRITAIELSQLTSRYPRTIGRNSHLGSHGDGPITPIVIIRSDQGAVGWGILRGASTDFSELIDRPVSELFDPGIGVISPEAKSLDFALHDLAGVVLDQPVWQMLGASGETVVPCYDGAIYFDDLDPEGDPRGIDAIIANCEHDYQLGHRSFKLKIGRGYKWMERAAGLLRDIQVTRAVHRRFPDCSILVDPNNGYDARGFLGYLDGVRDCDLYWVEEPFQEERDDLTLLRGYLDEHSPRTRIADGELKPDIPFLLELAKDNLLDVLIMDIVSLGFTEWRKLMPALQEIGVQASPHAWGVPVKSLYTAQLAAGLGNVPIVESVPGTTVGVDTSGYRLEEGNLHVPSTPGFGLALPAID